MEIQEWHSDVVNVPFFTDKDYQNTLAYQVYADYDIYNISHSIRYYACE